MPERSGEGGVVLASVRAREANRGVAWVVFLSLVLHGGAFGGVLYAASLKPKRSLELPSIPVELVTLGKRRDPDLLPRKVKPPPPAPKPDPAPAAEEAPTKPPPDAVALDGPEKKKQAKTPQRKRELSGAARALLEGAADARLDEAFEKLEDRAGSPDGSALGTTTDPSAAANTYEAKVKALLQSRYQLPMTVAPSQRRFLEAEVILYIDGQGRVTRFEFVERHRNQAFMNALEGLLRSIELPPPPRALASVYAREGVQIRFKP